MMLVELLKHAQFITFNKIRKYKYLDLFKTIIDEKNQKIRKKGLELIDECVREISKRDKNQQSSMLTGIFNEFFKDNQPKNESLMSERDSDFHYGVTFVIKSILTHANKEVFEVPDLRRMLDYIRTLALTKSIPLQIILLETYAPLSAYNHDLFSSTGGLDLSISHTLQTLSDPSASPDQQKAAYLALPRILEPFPPSRIAQTATQILTALLGLLHSPQTSAGLSPDSHLVACLHSVAEKAPRLFFDVCAGAIVVSPSGNPGSVVVGSGNEGTAGVVATGPQNVSSIGTFPTTGTHVAAESSNTNLPPVAPGNNERRGLRKTVSRLLVHGISEEGLAFLEFLSKVGTEDVRDEVEGKVLLAISFVLTEQFYGFGKPALAGARTVAATSTGLIAYSGLPAAQPEAEADLDEEAKLQDLETFKAEISSNLGGLEGGNKGERSAQLVCSALRCLSRFRFAAFQGQMVGFWVTLGCIRQRPRAGFS